MSNESDAAIYLVGFWLVGLVVFVGSWIYCIISQPGPTSMSGATSHCDFFAAFDLAHRAFFASDIAFRAFADIFRRDRASWTGPAFCPPRRRMNFTGRSSRSTASRRCGNQRVRNFNSSSSSRTRTSAPRLASWRM